MSLLSLSRQTCRASSSLLRCAKVTGISCSQKYHFSNTGKAKGTITATQPSPGSAGHEVHSFGKVFEKTPVRKQLNVIENAQKPEFNQAVSKIMAIRQDYINSRFVWVPSEEMAEICLGLGATRQDLANLSKVNEKLYFDPTIPCRKTRGGRFCLDQSTHSIRRLEFQPYVLSVEEGFKRFDSGHVRRYDELHENLQYNTVLQAMLVFKAMVINGVKLTQRPKLDYAEERNIVTVFNVRTTTNEAMLGEPAIEGVHQDGVDHTMTTMLGHSNMRKEGSGVTFMHNINEETGIPLVSANPANIRARIQHMKLLDTLLIVDHENKHSLSPVYQEDMSKDATRDMLICFTRKPVKAGHISSAIDSMRPHPEATLEIPLFL